MGVNVDDSHAALREHCWALLLFLCGSRTPSLPVQRLLLDVVDLNPKLVDEFESTAQTEPSTRLEIFMSSSS